MKQKLIKTLNALAKGVDIKAERTRIGDRVRRVTYSISHVLVGLDTLNVVGAFEYTVMFRGILITELSNEDAEAVFQELKRLHGEQTEERRKQAMEELAKFLED